VRRLFSSRHSAGASPQKSGDRVGSSSPQLASAASAIIEAIDTTAAVFGTSRSRSAQKTKRHADFRRGRRTRRCPAETRGVSVAFGAVLRHLLSSFGKISSSSVGCITAVARSGKPRLRHPPRSCTTRSARARTVLDSPRAPRLGRCTVREGMGRRTRMSHRRTACPRSCRRNRPGHRESPSGIPSSAAAVRARRTPRCSFFGASRNGRSTRSRRDRCTPGWPHTGMHRPSSPPRARRTGSRRRRRGRSSRRPPGRSHRRPSCNSPRSRAGPRSEGCSFPRGSAPRRPRIRRRAPQAAPGYRERALHRARSPPRQRR
jgi:hypothetical protein